MKVFFAIPYQTRYGQELLISINSHSSKESATYKMEYKNGVWNYLYTSRNSDPFTYSYILSDNSGDKFYEAGPPRVFTNDSFNEVFVYDQWRSYNSEAPFLSTAYKQIFFGSTDQIIRDGNITFSLSANNISNSNRIKICGNCKELGDWDLTKAPSMQLNNSGLWEFTTNGSNLPSKLEYKFAVEYVDNQNISYVWEDGENRFFHNINNNNKVKTFVNHFSIRLTATKPRIAGTAIPVFSLRTNNSCGIGDFKDLKLMVDLMEKTSQNVLQILPINDTIMTKTWVDSYPYGAISIYAIHPMYLNLEEIGIIKDREFTERFKKRAEKLNKLEEIDYEKVNNLKWNYISKIYTQEAEKTFKTKDYKEFFASNKYWLIPYAAFSFLRDKYKTANFRVWKEHSLFNREKIELLCSPDSAIYDKIAIHFFVQYHLHKQLSEAHIYANSKKVILKGDIPIGINKNSVEAWAEPHLFNFNGQAGAPPDDFSVKGQNWGFPTYKWDVMEKDGYAWWKNRFRKMEEYFDAYRIDHILGFFRIWEIPTSATEGLLGIFKPSIPFTKEEISGFGFNFNPNRDCNPFIQEWILDEYFAYDKDLIKPIFFVQDSDGTYHFKEHLNTQQKIEDFIDKCESEIVKHKEALLSICADLIFIEDLENPGHYYPRISAQFTKSYQTLDYYQKEAYNRIYNHFFYERNDHFWYSNAMKKLPALISSTGMLVCGEDLGMIPACVPSAMDRLKITSLEIQRMPKDPKDKFGYPNRYPYLSVCTTGTHDTSTLRGWWEEDRQTSQEYYNKVLNIHGEAPYYCETWLCQRIIEDHLHSPSMLAVLPLQDWLSIFENLRREDPNVERINVPANPKHYWRYRMHTSIEELISNQEFVNKIKDLIIKSGRELNS